MEFNSIGFRVFNIPSYFFCAFTGVVIATCSFIILLSSKKYNLQQHSKAFAISIIGLVISARMFGCFTGVYRALGNHEVITFDTIKNTGIVFYGGLIGMLVTYNICIRSKLITQKDYHILDVLAVTFPLFHTIARIGCFLAGCCYGIEKDTVISIRYTILESGTSVTALRIPVQLLEASFNFGLFIYLLMLLKTTEWKKKYILYRYLILYSVARFFLEFLRGDEARGIINGISFSQVISVGIWIFVVIRIKIKKKTEEEFSWEQ